MLITTILTGEVRTMKDLREITEQEGIPDNAEVRIDRRDSARNEIHQLITITVPGNNQE